MVAVHPGVEQALQYPLGFRALGYAGNTSDRFSRELEAGIVLGPHGPEEASARGLEMFQEQSAGTGGLRTNLSAAEFEKQIIQTLKVRALLHEATWRRLPIWCAGAISHAPAWRLRPL
jgi:hypothetical protein